MPTGYTAAIADGISFEQFAWNCARNFGALITMRDDPADAPVPQKFEPSSFYKEWLDNAKAELDRLDRMTLEEAAAAEKAEREKKAAYRDKRIKECNELRSKYEAMLGKVRAWVPPSPDHVNMKSFMEQQIAESIRFDCNTTYLDNVPPVVCAADWLANAKAEAARKVANYSEEWAKELDRVASRNRWVEQLRASIPQPAKAA